MLIAKPKFLSDESAASVLLRAAYLNGWPTVGAMLVLCRPLAPQLNKALRDRDRYLRYASTLGIDVPSQYGPYRVFYRGGPCFELSNEKWLDHQSFRLDGAALCPDCLSQDQYPYLRRTWQIRIFLACPDHGCLLVEQCDHCNLPLDWNRPAPHLCKCGFDLRGSRRKRGDIELAREVSELILSHDQKRLTGFSQSFCAHVETLGIASDTVSQSRLLGELWVNGSYPCQMLRDDVVGKIDCEHPRLRLLPLLRRREDVVVRTLLAELEDERISMVPIVPPDGLISAKDAGLVLGIMAQDVMIELGETGALSVANYARGSRGGLVNVFFTRASCDALLRRLWRQPSIAVCSAKARSPTFPVFDFIQHSLRHPEEVAGYDLHVGLSTLRMFDSARPVLKNNSRNLTKTFVTQEEASTLLGVKKNVIASLTKRGWLTSIPDDSFPLRKLVSSQSIAKFDTSHICAVRLAKELGLKPGSFFLHRLRAAGLLPVAGPGIDGTVVFIMRRSDLCRADMFDVMHAYDGVTRHSDNECVITPERTISDENAISMVDVSKLIGVTLLEVRMLISRQLLQRVQTPSTKVMLSQQSFDAYLERWQDKRFVDLDEVLTSLKETKMQFIRRWVVSKIVRTYDLGIRVRVAARDVLYIKALKRRYVSAPDCQKKWQVGRFTLPNLESQGLIKARRLGLNGQVRLYRRRDVEALLGAPPLQEGTSAFANKEA